MPLLDTSRTTYIANQPTPPAHLPSSLPFHDAVADGNVDRIRTLRSGGVKPTQLDSFRRTAVDVLDASDVFDADERKELRRALLGSRNPSAPAGYVKPEAFHGTPWGVEILKSGALLGGRHDPAGGSQALEGQVFFSDRTPVSDGEAEVRSELRRKPRVYAESVGNNAASFGSRAKQHRLCQALVSSLDHGRPLNLLLLPLHITVSPDESVEDKLDACLQAQLARTYLHGPSLQAAVDGTALPEKVVIDREGSPSVTLEGPLLRAAYREAFGRLKDKLENGGAPILAVLNEGKVVPTVFGFERVRDVRTHIVHRIAPLPEQRYSYLSESHPLSGSLEHGGRLKEIEVASLEDLATLLFATLITGTVLADDLLIRIKSRERHAPKALYLTNTQWSAFRDSLSRQALAADNELRNGSLPTVPTAPAASNAGSQETDGLGTLLAGRLRSASLDHLQALNRHLREQPLAAWVVLRQAAA